MDRLKALDGLRGLAAVVVVVHHCSLVLPHMREAIEATIVLRPLVAGPEAVHLFFVLSGFVLFRMLSGEGRPDYRTFVIRRIGRIYPALVASVLGSAALCLLVGDRPVAGASVWFTSHSWQGRPTVLLIAQHLALFHAPIYRELDNAVWSLAPELELSLLFPVVMLLARQSALLAMGASLLLSLCITLAGRHDLLPLADTLNPVGNLTFAYLFVAGALLASRAEKLHALGARHPGPLAAGLVLLAGLALLCATPDVDAGYVEAAGAILLVALCAYSPHLERWLSPAPIAWLGQVSYSLYLIHLPVLLAVVHGLVSLVPIWLAIALAAPLSLLAAAALNRWIEAPTIRWFRNVGRRSRARAAASRRVPSRRLAA